MLDWLSPGVRDGPTGEMSRSFDGEYHSHPPLRALMWLHPHEASSPVPCLASCPGDASYVRPVRCACDASFISASAGRTVHELLPDPGHWRDHARHLGLPSEGY